MHALNRIAIPPRGLVAADALTIPVADHPDSPLSRLEAQYTRLMEGEGAARTEQEQADFLAAQDRLVASVFDTPAETILGLAIKLRIATRYAGLAASPDTLVTSAFLATLRDAERLVRKGAA